MFLVAHERLVQAARGPSRTEDPFSMDAQDTLGRILDHVRVREAPRVSMAFANCFGGWTFGEPQLRTLAKEGSRRLSPHQAVAWFPAAAQGRTTIRFGLQCSAITFSAEFFAFYDALTMCEWWLNSGLCDVALACAAESSGSRFLHRAVADHGDARDSCVWWALAAKGSTRVSLRSTEDGVPRGWPLADPLPGISHRGATMVPLIALQALECAPCRARIGDQIAIGATQGAMDIIRLDGVDEC